MSVYDFLPPYHGELAPDNRWVRLAEALNWDQLEQEYSTHFARGGKDAIPARVAIGSLVVRAAYHVSDKETLALVRESPYLQYFLGLETFGDTLPFSHRSMERFRLRISEKTVRKIIRQLRTLE